MHVLPRYGQRLSRGTRAGGGGSTACTLGVLQRGTRAGGGAPAGNAANNPFEGFSTVSLRASSTKARNRFSWVFKAAKRSFAEANVSANRDAWSSASRAARSCPGTFFVAATYLAFRAQSPPSPRNVF